jgi:ABC-2 type transport system ATP-binding protein
LLPQEGLTEAIAKLLNELNVVDLTVTEPPIEEVIGEVFQAGAV